MKGRRTISPLLPSETTSRSVPTVSMETACWAFMVPEMAGAFRPSTDSGVNRMLSPVFCATVRRASERGCSCRLIVVSWAAAAAWMDRAATPPMRTERRAPQRENAMLSPCIHGHCWAADAKQTYGGGISPPPGSWIKSLIAVGGKQQGVTLLADGDGQQFGERAGKSRIVANAINAGDFQACHTGVHFQPGG